MSYPSLTPKLYGKRRHPYYLMAPAYDRLSSGIRVMHQLCDCLNRLGEEAYISSPKLSPQLRTPALTPEVRAMHAAAGLEPIAIYPEIIGANPLNCRTVVRYILNRVGLLGEAPKYGKNDLFWLHNEEVSDSVDHHEGILHMPAVDTSIFNNEDNPDDGNRQGACIYYGRYIEGSEAYPELHAHCTVITKEFPDSHQALADLFRRSTHVYCFENTSISMEARLCGCPVVQLPSPYVDLEKLFAGSLGLGAGLVFSDDEATLAEARAALPALTQRYKRIELNFWQELKRLIAITQSVANERQKQKAIPKIGILTLENPFSPRYNQRIGHILGLLGNHLETVSIARSTRSNELIIDEKRLYECDTFIVQREFPSPTNQALLDKLIATGRPIIYDTDEPLEQLSAEHPEFGSYALRQTAISHFVEKADLILVNSRTLAEHYRTLDKPALFFADHLPASIWEQAQATCKPSTDPAEPLRIGLIAYRNSIQSSPYVEEALLRLAHLYENRVQLIIAGEPSENLRTLSNVAIVKLDPNCASPAQQIANLRLDIGLLPLSDEAHNRFKSDLQWLQFAALGIATIVSDLPCFAEAVENELTIAVENEPQAWFDALIQLIDDESLRKRLADEAQSHALQMRTLEGHARHYAEILNTVLPHFARIPTDDSLQLAPLFPPHADELAIDPDAYRDWRERTSIQETDAEVLAERMMAWPMQPLVTLLTVARRNDVPLLAETTDSLQHQLYGNWHFWVISDQPCPDPVFMQADFLAWIQVDTLDDAAGLAELVNHLLEQNGGDVFGLLPPGTRLEAQALLLALDRFMGAGNVAAVYTDHDYHHPRDGGRRPQFKPDFDLEWLRSADYIGSTVFFKTSDVLALGGLLPYPEAMHYELLLRLAEHPEVTIAHEPRVLLSLPISAQTSPSITSISRQAAIEQHLARCGAELSLQPGLIEGNFRIEPITENLPRASIVIAVRDVFHLAEDCLTSLFEHTDYPDYEVLVVDNGSEDPDIHRLYALLQEAQRPLRVIAAPGPYSLAGLYNRGAAEASGEVLVFVHADCVFPDRHWLTRLVRQTLRDEIGVAGPLVLQPESGLVDNAGLFLGGTVNHFSASRPALRGLHMDEEGYMGMLRTQRTVSAVSSIGLTVRRERFMSLGGFDETFASSHFEVDFCLRAAEQGWKTIYTPFARIVHHGGGILSRLLETPEDKLKHARQLEQAQAQILKKWGHRIGADPHASPHFGMAENGLRLEAEFPLAWPTEHHQRARVLGFPVIGGSGEYRVKMPFKALVEAGWMYAESARPNQPRMPSAAEMLRLAPDCVLLHQKVGSAITDAIEAWKTAIPELRVVFGLDDRMDAIPFKSNLYQMHQRGNPDARHKLRKILKACDTTIVSTEPLVELVQELAGEVDVRVIPNSLVRQTWEKLTPKRRRYGKPRVGWVGAHQHRGDLELIIPVLEATHKQVDWVFMGMWLPEFQGLVKEKHPAVNFIDYPAAIAALDLDLAIAPLEINPFNEAKSNLRLLEYGILGYPVICTDIYPYQTMDAPVLRLPNQPKRWIEAILDKVADRDALQREGAVLREWVMRHFLLEQHLPAWNDALLKS